MFEPGTKSGAGWPANSGQLARLKASGGPFATHRPVTALPTSVDREIRHRLGDPRPLTARWRLAFRFSPLVATGLALCLVDLMTALLAMRLFDRVHAAVPGSALSDYRPQALLVLAAILALLPLLHLISKLFIHAAHRSSRRHAWFGTARVMLCVPASLCPVTVITLLLATGH
ncbi:hypothetical protein DBIPINDM_005135 [Mesorhizobium sp. AR02]|uniref:hypothetical protein n=1 Tax=Mesorhizobium sp. AR02 TaxID=2865837 RepID=UPI00215FDF1A|nr:hypothetical protein [Mesorhizobium sp. AR02]UVK51821.1 hypothetical protein DBIPINDM_005135 [Mesorhizobium sp. AR02]